MYNENVDTPIGEFQDLVNRVQLVQGRFSHNGDYIIAGCAQKSEHNIYIWETATGHLEKILEGPKQGILDLVVCDCRCCVVVTSLVAPT